MSTVDLPFAERVKAGAHNDEVRLIVEYTNAWGKQAYGLVMFGQENHYRPSDFVIEPKIWWTNPDPMDLKSRFT